MQKNVLPAQTCGRKMLFVPDYSIQVGVKKVLPYGVLDQFEEH